MPLPAIDMSTSKLTGSTFPTPAMQQPYRYGRRESGRWSIVPAESTNQSLIDNIAYQADFLGLNYDFTGAFGKSRVEVEYNYNHVNSSFPGSTTESQDYWEIVPQKAFKDILDSNNPLVLQCGQGALSLMKQWKQQNTLTTAPKVDANGLLIIQQWGSGPTNFTVSEMQLLQLLVNGTDQVQINAPVLTHTKTVTANYINPADFAFVGHIYSTSTLISTESIPSTVLFDFPVNSDPSPIPIGSTGMSQVLLYGWQKNAPQVRGVEKQKFNMVQTYEYGLWPIIIFPGQARL